MKKYKIKDQSEVQKILEELVSYYNEQRVHDETGEIPSQRWHQAITAGKGELRSLDLSIELDRVFSIHLKGKTRKDGTIMFMGRKWFIGCPEGTLLTICLIPNQKFMVYKEDKKIWEFHL